MTHNIDIAIPPVRCITVFYGNALRYCYSCFHNMVAQSF